MRGEPVIIALTWIALGAATFPVWGALLGHLWEAEIRPRLVRQAEIEALADALVARYGAQAEEIAFIEEDRAWRYAETTRQGTWHRVRRTLRRRTASYPAGEPGILANTGLAGTDDRARRLNP